MSIATVVVQYSSEEEEEGLDDALSQLNKKKKVTNQSTFCIRYVDTRFDPTAVTDLL